MLNLEESFANAFGLYEGARRGRNTRKLEVYRSDDGPAHLGHFYFVTSLGRKSVIIPISLQALPLPQANMSGLEQHVRATRDLQAAGYLF